MDLNGFTPDELAVPRRGIRQWVAENLPPRT
jgi:hypothetical protein